MGSASSDDSDEEREYIDSFRSSASNPSGAAYGTYMDTPFEYFGLGGLGIGLGRSIGSVSMDTTIDPENTPTNNLDDVYVHKATRVASHLVIFLRTIQLLTLGLGTEDGYLEFEIEDSNNRNAKRTFPFSYNYLHVSLAFGDSEGLYFSVLMNFINSSIPGSKQGGFSGDSYALIVGWVF